ncbi:Alpha/Beta hydrolase protein [Phycomyces nitens]|nr:Alpha/Beta hydrolase protein [Phycomyces nitens]
MVYSLTWSLITSHIRGIVSQHSSTVAGFLSNAHRHVIRKPRRPKQTFQVLYPQRMKQLSARDSFFAPTPLKTKADKLAEKKLRTPSGLDMPVTPNYVPPRAPVVLCHGLYGFDKRGPDKLPLFQVQYWGGIENALAKMGAKVIVTRVPSTGSISERAQVLHRLMKSVLAGKDINFIAHSMGGLDCRHLIANIPDRPYRVQSLTTISTPHRGSPVMDWFRDNVGVGMTGALVNAAARKMEKNEQAAERVRTLNALQGILHTPIAVSLPVRLPPSLLPLLSWSLADIAKMPAHLLDPAVARVVQLLDTPAYANLSTDYCTRHFNLTTPNDPRVAYYSYGGSAKLPAWSLLGLPHQLINEKEGENDGFVSVKSAQWGQYIKTLEADHWDLNGQRYRWRSTRPTCTQDRFNVVEFYLEMVTRLYHQGH